MTFSHRSHPWDFPLPGTIEIVPDGSTDNVDLEKAVSIIESYVGVGKTFTGKSLFPGRVSAGNTESLTGLMAAARVHNPTVQAGREPPLKGELDYERRRLSTEKHSSWGMLYDGHLYLDAVGHLVGDINPGRCVIIVSSQLIGTFEPLEKRYHARVAVYGFPSIISIPGIVVAPARSRSYHIARRMGLPGGDEDDHLDHNDPRLSEVLPGLLLQALFFHMTGDPFCDSETCRLFNAHSQAQLIGAQLGPDARLCEKHKLLLETKK